MIQPMQRSSPEGSLGHAQVHPQTATSSQGRAMQSTVVGDDVVVVGGGGRRRTTKNPNYKRWGWD